MRKIGVSGAGEASGRVIELGSEVMLTVLRSDHCGVDDADGLAAQADAIRDRASGLAAECGSAYTLARASLAAPNEIPADRRDAHLGRALADAAEAPLRIGSLALDLVVLASGIVDELAPRFRPDAIGAATLAAAAAASCERLVEVNLGVSSDDARLKAARRSSDLCARSVAALQAAT